MPHRGSHRRALSAPACGPRTDERLSTPEEAAGGCTAARQPEPGPFLCLCFIGSDASDPRQPLITSQEDLSHPSAILARMAGFADGGRSWA